MRNLIWFLMKSPGVVNCGNSYFSKIGQSDTSECVNL